MWYGMGWDGVLIMVGGSTFGYSMLVCSLCVSGTTLEVGAGYTTRSIAKRRTSVTEQSKTERNVRFARAGVSNLKASFWVGLRLSSRVRFNNAQLSYKRTPSVSASARPLAPTHLFLLPTNTPKQAQTSATQSNTLATNANHTAFPQSNPITPSLSLLIL